MMKDQAKAWSLAARTYEENFVDPYLPDVRNPMREALAAVAGPDRIAADLGCGLGPLLPVLASSFQHVYAVDFAPGMLDRAREACPGFDNVEFLERRLTDLDDLAGKLDVAVAVNSLVMPGLEELEASLRSIHGCLKPGGKFLGIVPSIDGVHYYTMLLKDRALATGMPEDAANKNAAAAAEHEFYDFAFGEFRYKGLVQHFWQSFEIGYRLRRAGFRKVRRAKVHLSWSQFKHGREFEAYPPTWDWFFEADAAPPKRRSRRRRGGKGSS
jgi:SAM-dependent methyltransferase